MRATLEAAFAQGRRRASRAAAVAAALALVTVLPTLVAVPPARAAAGDISTFAGGPGAGPGTSVTIKPGTLAARGGSVYITDDNDRVVRALDVSSGQLSVAIGNGDLNPWASSAPRGDGTPATSARLIKPGAVALDPSGALYVGDSGEGVRRVGSSGTITTVIDSLTPVALAFDASGGLYTADAIDCQLRRVDTSGTVTPVTADCPWGAERHFAELARDSTFTTTGLAFSPAGELFVSAADRVVKIDASGRLTVVAGGGSGGLGDGGPATGATLSSARQIAFDAVGNLYIADTGNNRVRRVDTSGVITTYAGGGTGALGDGGPATAAVLFEPTGVAVGSDGVLYIADQGNWRLRRVASDGTITTAAGSGRPDNRGSKTGLAIDAQLQYPAGIAVDQTNLYIADLQRNQVDRVDGSGHIATIVGTGARGASGDGGPAVDATLFEPRGLAVDDGGDLFIADSENGRIRVVDRDGIISTVAGGGTSEPTDGARATDVALFMPSALAWGPDGLHFSANGATWRMDRAGMLEKEASFAGALAIDDNGSLLIADLLGRNVYRVTGSGSVKIAGGTVDNVGYPATQLAIGDPTALAVVNGEVLIGNDEGVVYRVDRDGILWKLAGTGNPYTNLGDGGPAAGARLTQASALAVGRDGDVYVSDGPNRRIRQIEQPLLAASTSTSTTLPAAASTTTTTPPPSSTVAAPYTTWWQPGGPPLDGIGTWIYTANDPRPAPGQRPPHDLYAAAFGFTSSAAHASVGLLSDPAGKFALFDVREASGADHLAIVPFPWTAGGLFFPFVYELAPGTWGAWVYDHGAQRWAPIGLLSLPASWGKLSPASATTAIWYGGSATACSAFPAADVLFTPPIGYVGTAPSLAAPAASGVFAGSCPSQASVLSDWVRYQIGSTG